MTLTKETVLYVKPYVNHDIVDEVPKSYILEEQIPVLNLTWVKVKITHTNGSKEKF